MSRAFPTAIALLLAGVVFATPTSLDAQVRVALEWNGTLSGGPFVYAEIATGGAYVVGSVGYPAYRTRPLPRRRPVHVRRGVRIPPGHLPGPGECRVWHPNRPPGHQPPPFRCVDRYHAPYGAGYGWSGPRYRDRWDDHRYDDRDRWDDDWDDRYDDWDDRYDDWEDRYDDWEDEYEDRYEDRYDDWDDDWDDDRGRRRRGPAHARPGRGPGLDLRGDRGGWVLIEQLAKERQRELRRQRRR